jgi:hypothetical protein
LYVKDKGGGRRFTTSWRERARRFFGDLSVIPVLVQPCVPSELPDPGLTSASGDRLE